MPNEPLYDATYALAQLLRTQAQGGTKTKAIDATHTLSHALAAAPTAGVVTPTPITTGGATPTHTYRVEPLIAPKDDKKGKTK